VIALSPSLADGVHSAFTELVAGRATTPVGADGTTALSGVTALEAADCGPSPVGLEAVTRNVYVVPFVSPVTVVLVSGGEPVTVRGVCAVAPTYGVMM
jgi:hypothetical protein